jgi:predicted dehydrogenase
LTQSIASSFVDISRSSWASSAARRIFPISGPSPKGFSTEYKIKLHSGDIYAPQIENKEPLLEELKTFFKCIEKNKQPSTDLVNGLNVVRVLQAAQTSLRSGGKWIKI